MKKNKLLIFTLACLLGYFLLSSITTNNRSSESIPETNLPWQITPKGEHVLHVFGLDIGQSTLTEALKELGNDYELAWFSNPDQSISLEAYFRQVRLSGLLAKIVLEIDAAGLDEAYLEKNSGKPEILPSRSIKYPVADLAQALSNRKIQSITYIPKTSVEASMLSNLFGVAREVVKVDENSEYWLYPDKGLSILVNTKGKEVFQYVPLADFKRLSEKLQQVNCKLTDSTCK